MDDLALRDAVDPGGFRPFADGGAGLVHVSAHRALDSGSFRSGYAMLGSALEHLAADSSRSVHLHWHQLVFELELGLVADAARRFARHILPAMERGDAATDGPSALWRLALALPDGAPLPWAAARRQAARTASGESHAYAELHALLALGGARDHAGLLRYIQRRQLEPPGRKRDLLLGVATGLEAFAAEDWDAAATALAAVTPELHRLGGSRAQNTLFERIAARAAERAEPMPRSRAA